LLNDREQFFWANHPTLREQFRRSLHRRQFLLEFGDPRSGGA
jgi:hypothetical protein